MIDITRSYAIDAPIERVWTLLMDATAIAKCISGCDSLEPAGENRYAIKLTVKMAAVMGQYTGSVTLGDLMPTRSYRLLAEGRGRPGFVKGEAAIRLDSVAEATQLTVEGKVHTGGSIACVGQRVIGGAARFMVDGFFQRLKALAEGDSAGLAEAP